MTSSSPPVPTDHELLAADDHPQPALDSIAAPTSVIHGSADPMFPLEHGQALAEAIRTRSLRTTRRVGGTGA